MRFVAPVGTTVVEFLPADAQRAPDAILWNQGVLQAGRKVDFFVKLRLDRPGPIALQFDGTAAGLTRQAIFQLNVVAPSVDVSMVRVPEITTGQAEVGEIVYYQVGVRNKGTSTLVNVKMQNCNIARLARGQPKRKQHGRTCDPHVATRPGDRTATCAYACFNKGRSKRSYRLVQQWPGLASCPASRFDGLSRRGPRQAGVKRPSALSHKTQTSLVNRPWGSSLFATRANYAR